MRRPFLFIFSLFAVLTIMAQTPREEFKKNLRLSACSFLAYSGPQQPRLTPAPKGKQAFYISHYGRHGSCYSSKSADYNYAYDVLLRAAGEHALSPLGENVLRRLEAIRLDAQGRIGELTPLGVQQQRDIARRLHERFPEVLGAAAHIEARSTTQPSSILSMAAFTAQLQLLNPNLAITQDASSNDNHWLAPTAPLLNDRAAKACLAQFSNTHQCWSRPVEQLFADTAYLNRHVNGQRLNYFLFREASELQNSELSKTLTLYDLFSDDEIYENFLSENAWWFLQWGFSDLNGGNRPFVQAGLLRHIIAQADSCLHLSTVGCTLRFGHDEAILPLACLLGINGFGLKMDDLEQLERNGWLCYRIFPMAANIQFIFYRSGVDDNDILFKVLLNESETTLPLKSDTPPYYHWNDFRENYLQLLNNHENR